ncbi:MAG: hypothetical protein HC853_14785 [Anaerolineae bacterium]|nr:hypothetical protein [Anaerolineae bacterium]
MKINKTISMPTNRKLALSLLSLLIVCLGYAAWQIRQPADAVRDMAAIRSFVADKLPGVEIVDYRNRYADGDEEADIWLTLNVRGKGELILNDPTITSFTNSGSVLVLSIGDCNIGQPINFSNPEWREDFPKLYVLSATDLIARWDEVYNELLQEDEPRNLLRPHCLKE